jgi:hypothetical protein
MEYHEDVKKMQCENFEFYELNQYVLEMEGSWQR